MQEEEDGNAIANAEINEVIESTTSQVKDEIALSDILDDASLLNGDAELLGDSSVNGNISTNSGGGPFIV